MSSRHLELIRDLSARNREKEEQRLREEHRLKRRQVLLAERILGKPRGSNGIPIGETRAYLLEGGSKPDLKDLWENNAKKPRALPKLPVVTVTRMLGSDGNAGKDEAEADAAEGSPESMTRGSQQEKLAVTATSAIAQGPPVQGMQSFLGRLRLTRMRASCGTLSEWKKRNGATVDQKVFICCGGYPDFKAALLRRGWFQNEDKDSRHFDLKWAMASNMDHDHLQDFQAVNHFDRNREITTKVGLTRNLRSSAWHSGKEASEFYPRAFDLYDPGERAEFVLDFKHSKAEAILHGFLEDLGSGAAVTFSQDVVSAALKICMRTVTDPEEVMDCSPMAEDLGSVPNKEWDLLSKVNLDDPTKPLEGRLTNEELEGMIRKKTLREQMEEKRRAKEMQERKTIPPPGKPKEKKKSKKVVEDPTPMSDSVSSFQTARGQHLIQSVRTTLKEMVDSSRQYEINGRRNAWIVKPSGKSRGRGIQVMRDLDEIFKTTESDGFQWICQKYIEQPQLIHGYKFDIRQWVLVTDWNPLTVYIWRHPYLRFAGQKYDDTLCDRSEFRHLTNNSIMHDMDGFKQKNDDLDTYGYMWFRQQYEEYLHAQYCKCESHTTPFLEPPPYTCDYFGVRWEDVMFVAREEDDEEGDDDRNSSEGLLMEPSASVDAGEDKDGNEASEANESNAGSNTENAQDDDVDADPKIKVSRVGPRSQSPVEEPGMAPSASSSSTCLPKDSDSADAQSDSTDTGPASSTSKSSSSSSDAGAGNAGDASDTTCKQCGNSSGGSSSSRDCRCKATGEQGGEQCQDIWEDCIMAQMKEAIVNSLLTVQDEVRHRKGNFEMFGYDFMVSEGSDGPRVWLIEVNSSPACDYSTPVTCPLVKKVMEDTVKVVVDTKEDPEAGTGEWELIEHQYGKFITQRVAHCPQLVALGKEILPPKSFAKKKKKSKKKKRKGSKTTASAEKSLDDESDNEESGPDDEEEEEEEEE